MALTFLEGEIPYGRLGALEYSAAKNASNTLI